MGLGFPPIVAGLRGKIIALDLDGGVFRNAHRITVFA